MSRYSNHPLKHLSVRYYLLDHLLDKSKSIPRELDDRLLSGTEIFPENQQERMKRAIKEPFTIIPISKTASQVQSEESEYIVAGDPPTCRCEDFLFNCDYRHGEYCKHIWAVEFFQNCGVIPQMKNPKQWLIEQIQIDLSSAAEIGFRDIISKGLKLLSDISEKDNHYSNWKEFYPRWLTILETHSEQYSREYLTEDINLSS